MQRNSLVDVSLALRARGGRDARAPSEELERSLVGRCPLSRDGGAYFVLLRGFADRI
ncbi:MAG: hypothetical protein ACR2G5_13770 [Pyrinomonadaceae bacterium]